MAIFIKKVVKGFFLKIKRVFDVFVILSVLPILMIIILLIGILIRVTSGRPIFFRQTRIGRKGKPFTLYKFRTMNVDHADFSKWLQGNPVARDDYDRYRKLIIDPRITPMGLFLRKFSLDEIPQLINILRGDMSLIGPRPYMLDELDLSAEESKIILSLSPGITGWWQVMGRNETTFNQRKALDVYYVENRSFWMDLIILLKSPWVVISGTGR